MIYELNSTADLPYVGSNGDIAVVIEGTNKTCYSWRHGCWRHEDTYLAPLNPYELDMEPNV